MKTLSSTSSKVFKGYCNHDEHRLTEIINALFDAGRDKDAIGLRDCGSPIKFLCANCGKNKMGTYRCDRRVCLSCSRFYMNQVRHKVQRMVDYVEFNGGVYGFSMKMLTLTMRTDPEDISGALKRCGESVTKLWRNMLRKVGVFKGRRQVASGLHVQFELGPDNLNVHAHCLYYGPYVDVYTLSAEWLNLTGDSMVVDIRKCDRKGVNEVIKYASDLNKLSPVQIAKLAEVFEGKRRMRSYGIFYDSDLRLLEKLAVGMIKELGECECGQSCWMPEDVFMKYYQDG